MQKIVRTISIVKLMVLSLNETEEVPLAKVLAVIFRELDRKKDPG